MSKAAGAPGKTHDYKAHFTRTRVAYDKVIAAVATKAMQKQQSLQEEVDFLLDAINDLQRRAAAAENPGALEQEPTSSPRDRSAQRSRRDAASYSDEDEDTQDLHERSFETEKSAPSIDVLLDDTSSTKRPRSTSQPDEADVALLASLSEDAGQKRARLE